MVALVLTLAGVALISMNQGSGSMEFGFSAVLFGLLAGFCYSLYYIFGKHFSDRYSASVLFFYTLPFGALCLLPFFSFVEKSMTAWTALGAIAFLSTSRGLPFLLCGSQEDRGWARIHRGHGRALCGGSCRMVLVGRNLYPARLFGKRTGACGRASYY